MSTPEKVELPSVDHVKNHMQFLSKLLYKSWRMELAKNLNALKFKGEISVLQYHPDMSRLPNEYVRSALGQIQNELDVLEYDYSFKFDNVMEDNKWVLTYEIELPEDTDHCSFYEETDFFTKDDPKVDEYFKELFSYQKKLRVSTSDKSVCTRGDLIEGDDTFFFEKDYTYLQKTL